MLAAIGGEGTAARGQRLVSVLSILLIFLLQAAVEESSRASACPANSLEKSKTDHHTEENYEAPKDKSGWNESIDPVSLSVKGKRDCASEAMVELQ
jgi:hypothetical protein